MPFKSLTPMKNRLKPNQNIQVRIWTRNIMGRPQGWTHFLFLILSQETWQVTWPRLRSQVTWGVYCFLKWLHKSLGSFRNTPYWFPSDALLTLLRVSQSRVWHIFNNRANFREITAVRISLSNPGCQNITEASTTTRSVTNAFKTITLKPIRTQYFG